LSGVLNCGNDKAGVAQKEDVVPEDVPVHRRTMHLDAHVREENLEIVARLEDRRPWAEGSAMVDVVHDMELRVTVRLGDLEILEAKAVMHTFPHVECPAITEAFSGLVGLRVARGFVREVQNRFAGASGCVHLEHLARALGPLVVQAVTSERALAVFKGDAEDLFSPESAMWTRNSCHIWAEDGVAEQKLALGWRPGQGAYPAPSVVTFREKSQQES
jgi:hypothetical protein